MTEIPTRRLVFRGTDYVVDVRPANIEKNPVFAAAVQSYLQPLWLAAEMGRLSEERAHEALTLAYATGVVVGSPEPPLSGLDAEGWLRWLRENPEEFDLLRRFCEDPDTFTEGMEWRAVSRNSLPSCDEPQRTPETDLSDFSDLSPLE